MSILNNLPDRCNIVRKVFVKKTDGTGLGVPTETNEVVQSNVSCWVQPAGDSEVARYQKRGIDFTQKIYFTSDPGVTEKMIIIVTSRNGVAVPAANQEEWEVVNYPEPDASAGRAVVWKVMVNTDT